MPAYRVEITKDHVSISEGDRGWPPDWSKTITSLFMTGLAVYMISKGLVPHGFWSNPSDWPLMIALSFFAGSLLWASLRLFFPSGESLSCDGRTLTIGRIPDTSFRGRWTYETFPIQDVKELQFAAVRIGRYGGVMGLRFKVGDKTKKVLAGLESPEAAKVLGGLESLGLHVVHDPAMPMMIEMALSRRKR
jgi:hypothetical protein